MKMHIKLLTLALSVSALSTISYAAETEFFTELNATFKEIQARVTKREPRSNAILSVHAAPGDKFNLNYRFRIKLRNDEKATVELFWPNKDGDSGERYVVALDDDVKTEIERQQKLEKLLAQDWRERQAENAKRIAKLSGGQLTFGMLDKDIVKIRGRHFRFDSWQELGSGYMIYDDFRLTMRGRTLYDIEPTGELSASEKNQNLPYEDERK